MQPAGISLSLLTLGKWPVSLIHLLHTFLLPIMPPAYRDSYYQHHPTTVSGPYAWSVIQAFKHSNVIEKCNGIIYFYTGLPHISLDFQWQRLASFSGLPFFCFLVCVQYNTQKWENVKNKERHVLWKRVGHNKPQSEFITDQLEYSWYHKSWILNSLKRSEISMRVWIPLWKLSLSQIEQNTRTPSLLKNNTILR